MKKLRILDLFSGIGGFSLGLERTGGFETAAFCEIEKFPRAVLAKHWPEVPCYDDVRTLTGARLAADGITGIDVITGGFPCQDLSVAGKQAGMSEGTRSGLWSEIVRLTRELRPRYVICENVRNLLSGGDCNELPTDRCLCGWPYRWRRVPLGAEEGSLVHGEVRCGDGGEGAASHEASAQRVWRKSEKAEGGDREVGRLLEVGDFGQEVPEDAREDFAISSIEASAGGIALADGSRAWSDNQGYYFRVEPEGAERSECGSGLVCPSCGRSVANAASRHVYAPWFNRVLGDLAECGYDAEWENIPASAVGAPHRRERIWVIAYPKEIGREGRSETQIPDLGDLQREPVRGFEEWSKLRALPASRTIRANDGVPSRVDRIACCGNAVVPQIPELIGRAILQAESAA